jgi:hypothetical protein
VGGSPEQHLELPQFSACCFLLELELLDPQMVKNLLSSGYAAELQHPVGDFTSQEPASLVHQ